MGKHKSNIRKSSDRTLSHLLIQEVTLRYDSPQSFSITPSPSNPTAPALSDTFRGPQTPGRTGSAEPASETTPPKTRGQVALPGARLPRSSRIRDSTPAPKPMGLSTEHHTNEERTNVYLQSPACEMWISTMDSTFGRTSRPRGSAQGSVNGRLLGCGGRF